MNDNAKRFIGLKVEQVRCEAPEYQRFVGRQGVVVEAFEDEKGNIHCKTDDGVWCPSFLLGVL